jgi:hypothetical protein
VISDGTLMDEFRRHPRAFKRQATHPYQHPNADGLAARLLVGTSTRPMAVSLERPPDDARAQSLQLLQPMITLSEEAE